MKAKACGYVRLSRDDRGENYESIVLQKKQIEEWCEKNNCDLEKIYEDDNVSGYYFGDERKEFEQLNQDIENGKVKILIVKDLSRIGRHNAHTLLFLEKLQENDVRLIQTSKNYDSFRDDGDTIGIDTWYNEKYIKDISRKIKENLKTKQKEGTYMNKAPYGYQKNKDKKVQIDEESSAIIKYIFELYINGMGSRKIAEILNDKNILSPAAYYNTKNNTNFPCKNKWGNTQVLRMLKNDFYIGNHRCGKTTKRTIKGKVIYVNKEDQYSHLDNHEAIINESDFGLVQKIINDRSEKTMRAGQNGIVLFSGFLYCGDCGSKMIIRRNIKNDYPVFYLCKNYNDNGKKACSTHSIQEKRLIDIILTSLSEISDYCISYLSSIDTRIIADRKMNSNIETSINSFKNKIEATKEEIKNYLRQIIKNPQNEDLIKELIDESNNNLKFYNNQLDDLIKHKNFQEESKEKIIRSYDILKEAIEKKELSRKLLEVFLNKINVFQLNKVSKKGQRPKLDICIEFNAFFENVMK